MHTFLTLSEIREVPVGEPMVICWYEQGTRYGVAIRVPSLRKDAVKVEVTPFCGSEGRNLVLTEKANTRPVKIVDAEGEVYQLRSPVMDREIKNCYKLLQCGSLTADTLVR